MIVTIGTIEHGQLNEIDTKRVNTALKLLERFINRFDVSPPLMMRDYALAFMPEQQETVEVDFVTGVCLGEITLDYLTPTGTLTIPSGGGITVTTGALNVSSTATGTVETTSIKNGTYN